MKHINSKRNACPISASSFNVYHCPSGLPLAPFLELKGASPDPSSPSAAALPLSSSSWVQLSSRKDQGWHGNGEDDEANTEEYRSDLLGSGLPELEGFGDGRSRGQPEAAGRQIGEEQQGGQSDEGAQADGGAEGEAGDAPRLATSADVASSSDEGGASFDVGGSAERTALPNEPWESLFPSEPRPQPSQEDLVDREGAEAATKLEGLEDRFTRGPQEDQDQRAAGQQGSAADVRTMTVRLPQCLVALTLPA